MIDWLIIRTDFRKEHYVANQIERLGFQSWVPAQIIATRTAAGRRATAKPATVLKELPILPRRLFAAVPVALQADLDGIRHLVAIERDTASGAICVPHSQIVAFRDEIDRENTASLMLHQQRSRKQKAKWRSLHDALVEMIEQAKTQLERAA